MLGDIVRQVISEQPDMVVVGTLERRGALPDAVDDVGAEVVIVGVEGPELPDVCQELVISHPQIKVLAVSGDGRGAFLYELRPHTTPLGEVSPQGLVDAIRAAVPSTLRA